MTTKQTKKQILTMPLLSNTKNRSRMSKQELLQELALRKKELALRNKQDRFNKTYKGIMCLSEQNLITLMSIYPIYNRICKYLKNDGLRRLWAGLPPIRQELKTMGWTFKFRCFLCERTEEEVKEENCFEPELKDVEFVTDSPLLDRYACQNCLCDEGENWNIASSTTGSQYYQIRNCIQYLREFGISTTHKTKQEQLDNLLN